MRAAVLLLLASTWVWGQDPFHPTERIDQAHRPIFQPPPNKSKVAGEVTAKVAGTLPKKTATRQKIERRNYIDEYVFGRMERDGIPHAGLASDQEFARRAYLDATGRIPPVSELLEFLASTDPDKREKLIDRLVDSPAFVDRWAFYFEDLFRAGGRMGFGLNLFHYWVREWLRLDRPYSDVVTDLLTHGSKTSFSSPGALYFARDFVKAKDDPEAPDAHDLVNIPDTIDEFTVTYSKVFLGINLACISCHDGGGHLEKVNVFLSGKTREQFFQQAAFFGKTRQIMNWENGNQANQEYTVDDVAEGYDTKAESIVRVPRTGGSNRPQFVLSGEGPRPGHHWRDELARLVTGHVQFSRAFTNRIWAELMGFGIVEPVDEFDLARYDAKNPPPAPWTLQPSNPALLDAMAEDFRRQNFSFKHFVKAVMKSSVYQLSSRFDGEWKEGYTPYYARKYVRMLSAAELHDAIALVTSRPGTAQAGNSEKAPMVMEMSDPKRAGKETGAFLTVFGQSNRDEMPKKVPPSSLQAMLLMQSKLVTDRVQAKEGNRIEQLLKLGADDRILVERLYLSMRGRRPTDAELQSALDRALIDRLYLATVSRHPTGAETEVALNALQSDRKRGAENLQWALMNSPEFIFNY